MKTTLYKFALYGALLYVALVLLSFILTRLLPSFQEAGAEREYICYWRSTLIAFYECGEHAIAGGLREVFYNLWLLLFYAPMFAFKSHSINSIGLTLALYAPLFFLAYAFVGWIVRKLRGA